MAAKMKNFTIPTIQHPILQCSKAYTITQFSVPSHFWTICTKFDTCCQRYIATCGKSFLYRFTSTFSALNNCVGI